MRLRRVFRSTFQTPVHYGRRVHIPPMMNAAECVAKALAATESAAREPDAPIREHWLDTAAEWNHLAAMARVKIEEIIDHLSTEMRKALADAVNRTMPNPEFDERTLFREFKKAVARKCNTWERVPDHYVTDD